MTASTNAVAGLATGLALTVLSALIFASETYGSPINAARSQALRECSVKASRHTDHLEQNMKNYVYRTCMAERGQEE